MSSSGTRAWSEFLPHSLDQTGSLPFTSSSAGRRVLVTGAGGYIGSALVRAIAGARPDCLVLLDSSEFNLFEIQRHMKSDMRHVPCEAVLGSTVDVDLLDGIFARFRPEIIYHAAAFKQVPLLEFNPMAAVRNNAIGTWTVAQAAIRHGASKVVLISTDKAVNPHSVMGVSKRIAELAVIALSSPACPMNAIRLVNVMGSGGSVVPVWLQQIAERRPMTVTHPEVIRWFLSLRETVQAILACGAAACEGRIFLPELGEPVRIAALAEFFRTAASNGYPRELPVEFTGLRPGEKLTEEVVYETEVRDGFVEGPLEVLKTRRLLPAEMEDVMDRLSICIASRDCAGVIRTLTSVVPEYVPSECVLHAMIAPVRVEK